MNWVSLYFYVISLKGNTECIIPFFVSVCLWKVLTGYDLKGYLKVTRGLFFITTNVNRDMIEKELTYTNTECAIRLIFLVSACHWKLLAVCDLEGFLKVTRG